MNAAPWHLHALLSVAVLFVPVRASHAQEAPQKKGRAAGAVKSAARLDPAAVQKLIDQLSSKSFKSREKATRELSQLDEVPEALREAAKSADQEVRRRAQAALNRVSARVEERAFKALMADLHKVELDRLIRRMITDPKFAGDKQWEVIEAIIKAVTKKANELAGQQYPVPTFDMKALPLGDRERDGYFAGERRHLLRGPGPHITAAQGCVILCTGPTPSLTGLYNSVLIVDGDFTGATGVTNSLLIVRGNIGRVTSVRNSIILATGNFLGATGCDHSFVQVNNQRIRFTGSDDSVLIKTAVKTTGATTSRVLNTDRGPLQLLRFSERKTDAQLTWGKEVNGLAVAVTSAELEGKILVRWKNVAKNLLEMPWVRNPHRVGRDADDLFGHVFLKDPGGKLVPARQPARQNGGWARYLDSVVLGPGQIHEEVIDLWAYVQRPASAGRYELTIELNIPNGRRRMEREARLWTRKIRSNTLAISVGK